MPASTGMAAKKGVTLVKISAPRGSLLTIDRDKTVRALIECLKWKIVIIEAPAGFAKSNLLVESYRRLSKDITRWRVSWLSVDEADDSVRLWRHALAEPPRL